MYVADAITTAKGGMTSHAAVVARGIGKPCVCGVKGMIVNEKEGYFTTSEGVKICKGEVISVDGSKGNIIWGETKLILPSFSDDFKNILKVIRSSLT